MNIPKKVVLIGYSGHAYVAAEVIQLAGFQLAGYLEKNKMGLNPFDLEYLGYEGDENIMRSLDNHFFFPAIGSNIIRRKIVESLEKSKYHFINAIHPKANISSKVVIGDGTLVCQGANINPLAQIGKAVIINTAAIIEHECKIGDFAHIAPGAVLAGNVSIGRASFIGANAVVKQGISVGENVIIGAGAVVLNDIPDNVSFVGNPAKILLK